MKRLLPLFELGQLIGSDMTGEAECRGLSLSIQWLGLIIDINLGCVTGRKGHPK